MVASNRFSSIALDHVIEQAERLVAALSANDTVPSSAILAAEQVFADLKDKRRAMTEIRSLLLGDPDLERWIVSRHKLGATPCFRPGAGS